MLFCYHTCLYSDHVGVAFLVSRVCFVRTVSVVGLPRLYYNASLVPSPRCRVKYMQIQTHTCDTSQIMLEAPGFETNIPQYCAGNAISRISIFAINDIFASDRFYGDRQSLLTSSCLQLFLSFTTGTMACDHYA